MPGVLAGPELLGMAWESAIVNDEQGVLFTMGGYPVGAPTHDLNGCRIQNLRFQVDPDELTGLRRRVGARRYGTVHGAVPHSPRRSTSSETQETR
ncbi:hypothetical protein [Streptomyces vietnamensis]|uniref:hypothetical protein n=1 Tax=Streptomyces vietnamensis TaxID=362257 RepID=UPI00342F33D7